MLICLAREKDLGAIKKLGKNNSATLGFLPEGAFEQRFNENNLWVVVDNDDVLAYLMVRNNRGRITIVHLCVREDWRERGIGKRLAINILPKFNTSRGIDLKCRQEYAATNLWPQLGFFAQVEVPGRAKNGKLLVYWWRPHGRSNLLTNVPDNMASENVAVIDANVVFDFAAEESDLSDAWSRSERLREAMDKKCLQLYYTPEIFNEILRNNNFETRRQSRSLLTSLPFFPWDARSFTKVLSQLEPIFQGRDRQQDRSDCRQLAWAISAGFRRYTTRDESILSLGSTIENKFKLAVFRPDELITDLDSKRRPEAYRPNRFAETLVEDIPVTRDNRNQTVQDFLAHGLGESKVHLSSIIDDLMGDDSAICRVLDDKAVYGYKIAAPELKVVLLRINPRLTDKEAHGLFRRLLHELSMESVESCCPLINISDLHVHQRHYSDLLETGYLEGTNWYKLAFGDILCAKNLAENIRDTLHGLPAEIYESFKQLNANILHLNAQSTTELEHIFFPVLIHDGDVPCYMIPIQTQWAEQIVDERLAAYRLFGRETRLGLNSEAIYYTACRNEIKAPSRIIWYVSKDKVNGGFRAISRLRVVDKDKATMLYRRYSYRGIYTWDEVRQCAKGNAHNEIKALLFDDTRLLPKRLSGTDARVVLKEYGIGTQFMSPQRIPSEVFFKLVKTAGR